MRKIKLIFKLLFCDNAMLITWDKDKTYFDQYKPDQLWHVLFMSDFLRNLVNGELALVEAENILNQKNV